jgi:hypothetical protein
MKLGHAAALGLVSWYLIIPARVSDWPVLVYDTNAPLSKWQPAGSFYTAKRCNEDKKETAGLMLQTTEKMAGTGEDKQKAKQSIMTMLLGLQSSPVTTRASRKNSALEVRRGHRDSIARLRILGPV